VLQVSVCSLGVEEVWLDGYQGFNQTVPGLCHLEGFLTWGGVYDYA